ncbi:cyclin-dependent kinase A-1 [Cryptosporidium andersoni]|uniref:Cyclin-dependent kinase 2 homolog n=1 Tax=Cryptosporidium andersoni TaxID=117008 RepID=A0A1J4MHN2_9CRYT|nr:cyclin-dependent kinase A-1 [Cryptosporidium andersoni]
MKWINIKKFDILGEIYSGIYSTIFQVKDSTKDKLYALKVPNQEINFRQDGKVYLENEIKILSSIRNKYIIELEGVIRDKGTNMVYMVLEYVPFTLEVLINKSDQLSIEGKIKIIYQILKGVEYLHNKDIVHCDLKPMNILIDKYNNIKICDFGMARKLDLLDSCGDFRATTLWYRSPEILLGDFNYTKSSDIWSIGCIFGELLLGKPLFQGNSEIDQLLKIFQVTGTPNNSLFENFNSLPCIRTGVIFPQYKMNWNLEFQDKLPSGLKNKVLDLLIKLLNPCPNRRTNTKQALRHNLFCFEDEY